MSRSSASMDRRRAAGEVFAWMTRPCAGDKGCNYIQRFTAEQLQIKRLTADMPLDMFLSQPAGLFPGMISACRPGLDVFPIVSNILECPVCITLRLVIEVR